MALARLGMSASYRPALPPSSKKGTGVFLSSEVIDFVAL